MLSDVEHVGTSASLCATWPSLPLDPWESAHEVLPSYAFCLLLKFFKMKLTYNQMKGLLEHASPYARALGLLYLRFCTDPKELWDWYEPMFDDREEIVLTSNGQAKRYAQRHEKGTDFILS